MYLDNPLSYNYNLSNMPAKKKINTTRKPRKPLNTATEMAMRAIDGGADVRAAVIMATGNPNPHPVTISKYRTKYKNKWSLSNPTMDAIAGKTIKTFASGKEVNGITPTDKTCLAAASMIKDRTEPAIKYNVNQSIERRYIEINLSSDQQDTRSITVETPQDIVSE